MNGDQARILCGSELQDGFSIPAGEDPDPEPGELPTARGRREKNARQQGEAAEKKPTSSRGGKVGAARFIRGDLHGKSMCLHEKAVETCFLYGWAPQFTIMSRGGSSGSPLDRSPPPGVLLHIVPERSIGDRLDSLSFDSKRRVSSRSMSSEKSESCRRIAREDRLLLLCTPVTQVPEALARFRNLVETGVHWPTVLDRARAEGLSGLLYRHLRNAGLKDLVPAEALFALETHSLENAAGSFRLLSILGRILPGLEENDIRHLVLKGPALEQILYPAPGLRPTKDLDILVRKEDLRRADKALGEQGYAAVDAALEDCPAAPVGYLSSRDYRREDSRDVSVHLHWHLVNSSVPAGVFAAGTDLGEIWREARPVRLGRVETRVPAPQHLLVYLCEHAFRVGHSFDRLLLFSDILVVLDGFGDEDWKRAVDVSVSFGLHRLVYLTLRLCSNLFGTEVPPWVMEDLGRATGELRLGEVLFLRLVESNRRIRGSSYLVYLSHSRGFWAKARLVFRTFFPPTPVLLQRSYDPGRSALFLYAKRCREVLGGLWAVSREVFARD